MNEHRTEKKRRALRTVTFWGMYDPARGALGETARYKYQLPEPSAGSGWVLMQFKGHYVRACR